MNDTASRPAPLDRHLGRTRFGMERVGSTATLVLVLVLAAMMLGSAGLAHLVAGDVRAARVPAGTTVELGDSGYRLTVPDGWVVVEAAAEPGHLVLVSDGVQVDVGAVDGVASAPVLWARQVRLLALGGLTGDVSAATTTPGDPEIVTGDVDGDGLDAIVTVVVTPQGQALTFLASTPDGGLDRARPEVAELVQGVSAP